MKQFLGPFGLLQFSVHIAVLSLICAAGRVRVAAIIISGRVGSGVGRLRGGGSVARCGRVSDRNDAMNRVFPLGRGVDSLTIAFPAHSALLIDSGQVIQPLLPAQIPDLLPIQAVTRASGHAQFFPFAVIEPIEEILSGAALFPFLVICTWSNG